MVAGRKSCHRERHGSSTRTPRPRSSPSACSGTTAGSQSSRAVRAPPACSGPRDAADPGRLAAGDPLPDRSRPCQRRPAAGMDPALRPSRRHGAVEEINAQRPKGATPNTPRGPFYRAAAPRYPAGASISLDGVGEPLAVTRRSARTSMAGRSPDATVETWQANAEGHYENQQPDRQPDFNLRGVFVADAGGRLPLPDRQAGGLRGAGRRPGRPACSSSIGYPLRRPAHLQFMISAPGFETITTHVYDRSDPQVAEDALFGVREELLADFREQQDRSGKRLMGARLHLRPGPQPEREAGLMTLNFTYHGKPGADRVRRRRARISSARGSTGSAAAAPSSSPRRSRRPRRRRSPHRSAPAARPASSPAPPCTRRSRSPRRRSRRRSAAGADCLVALGGGSTTGLGKAIACRTDLPQIVDPDHLCRLGGDRHPRPDRRRA